MAPLLVDKKNVDDSASIRIHFMMVMKNQVAPQHTMKAAA